MVHPNESTLALGATRKSIRLLQASAEICLAEAGRTEEACVISLFTRLWGFAQAEETLQSLLVGSSCWACLEEPFC